MLQLPFVSATCTHTPATLKTYTHSELTLTRGRLDNSSLIQVTPSAVSRHVTLACLEFWLTAGKN